MKTQPAASSVEAGDVHSAHSQTPQSPPKPSYSTPNFVRSPSDPHHRTLAIRCEITGELDIARPKFPARETQRAMAKNTVSVKPYFLYTILFFADLDVRLSRLP